MADKVLEFQKGLLSSVRARQAFAKDPAGYLRSLGIVLPEGTRLPASIPIEKLESTVAAVNRRMKATGTSLEDLERTDATAVSKFVRDALGPKVQSAELGKMRTVVDEFGAAVRGPQSRATVAVLGAVVAVVVAVPVAVYGAAPRVEEGSIAAKSLRNAGIKPVLEGVDIRIK